MAPRRSHLLYFVASGIFVLLVLSLQLVRIQGAFESSGRRVGVFPMETPQGLLIEKTQEGGAAERAGLRGGDLLLSVESHRIEDLADYDAAATSFRRDHPVRFDVRRGEQDLSFEVQPGAPPPGGSLTVYAMVALACLVLGLVALTQRGEDLRARLIAAFSFLLAIELSLPTAPLGEARTILVTESLFWLISGVQMAVELHLAAVVPQRRRWLSKPWVLPLLYGVSIGLGVLAWATFLGEEVRGRDLFPWSYGQVQSALNEVVLPLWAMGVLALLAGPAFRHPDPARRHQAALIFFGVLPLGLYALAGQVQSLRGLDLPAWTYDFFPLLVIFFPIAVFVAIFRYHLFDLELVVRRSYLYTALTTALVLTFYTAVGVVGMVFSKVIDAEKASLWIVSAAMFFVGLAFGTLRRLVQNAIDGLLFPARRAMHQRLVALARELPAQGTVANMGAHLLTHLGKIFAVKASTLLLSDPKSGLFFSVASSQEHPERFSLSFLLTPDDPALDRLREAGRPLPADQVLSLSPVLAQRLTALEARTVVPLLHNDVLIGVLVLGRRATRRGYRREEIEMLSLFAPQIATAFENIRLFESATYESLTGLLRREAILELLDKEIDRANRHRRPLVVGMADLDFFKEVNDRFGHLAGDAVLKRVAEELASGLRSTDAVGRYGGEEFLLVLPETDLEGGSAVAEKLRRSIEKLSLPLADGATVDPRISVGLAELPQIEAPRAEVRRRLIAAADRALYRAKERGRNRVEVTQLQEGVQQAGGFTAPL